MINRRTWLVSSISLVMALSVKAQLAGNVGSVVLSKCLSHHDNGLLMTDCNADENQQFVFDPVDDGENYYIHSEDDFDKCLSVAGATSNDDEVVFQDCSDENENMMWRVMGHETRRHIQNKKSRKCLHVDKLYADPQKTSLVQYRCGGGREQDEFRIEADLSHDPNDSDIGSPGIIKSLHAAKRCLDVRPDLLDSGDNLYIWKCHGKDNQILQFLRQSQYPGDIYRIKIAHSGMCLAVDSSETSTNILQLDCSESGSHVLWELLPAHSTFGVHVSQPRQIQSVESRLCMTIDNNARVFEGANVQQGLCDEATDAALNWSILAEIPTGPTSRPSASPVSLLPPSLVDDGILSSPKGSPSDTLSPTANPTAAPHTHSIWGDVHQMDITAAAAANLPNGKIITWSSYTKLQFGKFQGLTWVSLIDPLGNAAEETRLVDTGHDMFCPGTAVLADGRIMVTGGSKAEPTTFYNPDIDAWTRGQDMNIPRGYQSMTVLTDGSVFTMGGSWTDGRPGVGRKDGEVWHPSTHLWELKDNLKAETIATDDEDGIYRGDNHFWMFQAPNGLVFHAGPSKMTHWIDVSGEGEITNATLREENVDAMTGVAVMYDIGKILTLGGTPKYRGGYGTNNTHVIDINGGLGAVTAKMVGHMKHVRTNANAVVLPNGEVVVIGGQARSRLFTDLASVYPAEIWNPDTMEWTEIASLAVPRNYHSVALLLKDGRVWSGGGGLCGDCTNRDGTSANHPDYEILTPPYLLQSNGSPAVRPVILQAPDRIFPRDGTINVVVGSNENHSFALVRLGAVTHATNTDNRRIPLREIVSRVGPLFTLAIPSNQNIMVPGIYYLFAMNADGVPSEATSVVVEGENASVNTPPLVSQIHSEIGNGRCVDTSNQTVSVTPTDCDATVTLFGMVREECNTESSQYYTFEPVDANYRIRVGSTGQCLQVGSISMAEGAHVVAGNCCDEAHTLWSISREGPRERIKALHSGMCLAAINDDLVQQTCTQNGANDSWRLDDRISR